MNLSISTKRLEDLKELCSDLSIPEIYLYFVLGFLRHYHKSVLQKQRTSSLSVMCSDLSIPEMYDNYHNGLAGGGNNVDVFEFNEDDSEEN